MFVHIPKNGGLSVYTFLRGHLRSGDITVMEGDFDASIFGDHGIEKHAKAWRFKRWMESTGRDWDSYTSFAIIRDPLAHVQSVFWEARHVGYEHRHGLWWNRMDAAWWERFMRLADVNEFIASGLYDLNGPLPMAHLQRSFVVGESGSRIVKHLLLIDEMAEGVPRLLGLEGSMPLKHRGDYSPVELTPDSVAYIKDRYADDYALIEEMGDA
jgi:hypothetical protein